jgi:membrane-bound serine protease (ClpP class)
MSWRERLLATLSDPNIAYILFMLGLLGLYFELATPGAILPGVVGTICLLLAFFSFQTLPVNYAGVALIVLSVVLFIVDVKAATHGVLTIGGLVAMFIGSVMLFKASPVSVTLSMHVVIPVVAATASFFAIGAWLSLRAMRRRPTTGDAGLLELEGDARTDIAPAGGTVFVAGAHWTAVSRSPIGKGTRIRVTAVKGMILEVEAVPGPGAKP